jgi:hypothetical protein
MVINMEFLSDRLRIIYDDMKENGKKNMVEYLNFENENGEISLHIKR